MLNHRVDSSADALRAAERRLFAACGVEVRSSSVALSDPPVRVRVLDAGAGPPLLLIHGSGMTASTWAPLMARLPGRRLLAVDLPGFGFSDPFDYRGRSLRAHAVAQVTSLLDALELERVAIVGTSLGAMWALCAAIDAPDRVSAVTTLGVPAVALPGMRGDPVFTLMTTPGIRHVASRTGSPSVAMTRRSLARGAIGPRAAEQAPEGFFETVHAAMRRPAWRLAMRSHLWLAMHRGRPRPENLLSDAELRRIAAPVRLIWGKEDPYGGPEIGMRAAALMSQGRLEVMPGRHAPFLDDPERCARVIAEQDEARASYSDAARDFSAA